MEGIIIILLAVAVLWGLQRVQHRWDREDEDEQILIGLTEAMDLQFAGLRVFTSEYVGQDTAYILNGNDVIINGETLNAIIERSET